MEVVLVRHGETEWSRDGRHTGRTDVPLTQRGEEQARAVGEALRARSFALVLSSPLQRALQTAQLAGFSPDVREELREWDYGEYEGQTSTEIMAVAPGWRLFDDGCPGGESPAEVSARADRVIARVRSVDGTTVLFAHGHLFRVLAARWLGWPPATGAHLLLDPATVSLLSDYRGIPAIKRWNIPSD